jgi:hypothetical protein
MLARRAASTAQWLLGRNGVANRGGFVGWAVPVVAKRSVEPRSVETVTKAVTKERTTRFCTLQIGR